MWHARPSSDVTEMPVRLALIVVVLFGLAGCAQVTTKQGQAPVTIYPQDSGGEIRGGAGGGGGGM
jgi:hypothetical protein